MLSGTNASKMLGELSQPQFLPQYVFPDMQLGYLHAFTYKNETHHHSSCQKVRVNAPCHGNGNHYHGNKNAERYYRHKEVILQMSSLLHNQD